MGFVKERVSYLKGLAEGMQISDSTNEGKLLKAIIDVLDDIALTVDDIEEVQEQLCEQVDTIDEDLAEIEKVVLDETKCLCDHADDCVEDDGFVQIECPHCNEEIDLNADMINEDDVVQCPICKKDIDIEWECNCGEHDDNDE